MKKKLIILFVLLLLTFSLEAQRSYFEKQTTPTDLLQKAPTDTLWPGNALNASAYVMLADSNGGYVLGTNSYEDIAKGQIFLVDSGYIVEGAIFWFGVKTAQSTDSIRFVLWKLDSLDGYGSSGGHQPSPGTELASLKYCIQDIDTSSSLSNACVMFFPSPVSVYEDYMLGFEFGGLSSDSIGLWSTANGDGEGNELVWEQWGLDSSWHSLQASGWGFPALLDVDAMILPIVDMSSIGIADRLNFYGFRCSIYPNPVQEFLNLEIELAEDMHNINILLLDKLGRSVGNQSIGEIQAGIHQIRIDVDQLTTGNYFCAIYIQGSGMALPFTVAE